jgi:hypothetical protein
MTGNATSALDLSFAGIPLQYGNRYRGDHTPSNDHKG